LPDHPQTLLGRYDVLDWGDGCVIYDRSLFLTHLLDEPTALMLRARLAEASETDSPAHLQALLDELLPASVTDSS